MFPTDEEITACYRDLTQDRIKSAASFLNSHSPAQDVALLINVVNLARYALHRLRPPTTPGGRSVLDAIGEAERLLQETSDKLDPDNARDAWFMARITKISEALADRPKLGR